MVHVGSGCIENNVAIFTSRLVLNVSLTFLDEGREIHRDRKRAIEIEREREREREGREVARKRQKENKME